MDFFSCPSSKCLVLKKGGERPVFFFLFFLFSVFFFVFCSFSLCLLPLDGLLGTILASLTFHSQNNLLGGLGLLVEHGFGLSSEPGLLSIVTTFSLGKLGGLSRLVLGHLEPLVALALDVRAKVALALGNVHLQQM